MKYGKTPFLGLLSISLIVAMSVACPQRSRALVVVNNGDNGSGTLREAIQFNNSVGGGNTIVFSNTVVGQIMLTNPLGELVITKDVTILGPGAKSLAINGNFTSRVLHIADAATVVIADLTITNGYLSQVGSGAGIVQDFGSLTLSNCVIAGNAAPGYGGGIYFGGGNERLINCTIRGNSANGGAGSTGGGLVQYSAGSLEAVNCTFAGNSSLAGGGLGVLNGTAKLTNCTISANNAFAYDGGGIYVGPGTTVSVRNSLIAGNVANRSGQDCFGSFNSLGFNLIGKFNDSTGWGSLGDQVGTTNAPLGFSLSGLADNGGPTPTMMPQRPFSPAIDQGNSSGVPTDQRGRTRSNTNAAVGSIPLGGDRSDIGAVEVGPNTLVVSNLNDSGAGSLRQTIAAASPSEGDTITFAPGTVGTIALTTGELVIGTSLNIQGPTTAPIKVSGNNASRVFRITNHGIVNISSLTIADGNTAQEGAGLFNDFGCQLILNTCAVLANISGGNGGGLANNGSVIARNCTFSGNQAALNAGGIYTYAGPVTLRNCTIVSNTAVGIGGTGGGILSYSLQAGTSAIIGNTIVAGNSAASHPDIIGVFTSAGYNLIGRIDYSTAVGGGADGVPTSGLTNNFNHDLAGSLASPTNALLGPLRDNGGPTFTHALKPGSPAIDKGISNGSMTDQRGAPRPFDFLSLPNAAGGDASDIGALELGIPTLGIQASAANAVITWPFYYGDFTLQSVTNVTSTNWVNIPGTPAVVSSQYALTNAPISANQFFRLKGN